MTKTIKQWLETLLEPYRGQALENLANNSNRKEDCKADSLNDAILRGFTWEATPQGAEYWKEVRYSKFPVILTAIPSPPTCAIEALMTIALKKGLDVQDITEIWKDKIEGWWIYTVKENKTEFPINLKTE